MQSVDLDMFGPSTPGGQHGVVREESDEAMLSKKQREEVEHTRNGDNILDSSNPVWYQNQFWEYSNSIPNNLE